jgi:molybdopterin-containing oxidoreductase family iron-sulfur binding subunit
MLNLPILDTPHDESADGSTSSLDRRRFLQFSAAAAALAGLTGCSRMPDETIVPYVKAPHDSVPGEKLAFATTMPRGRDSIGLLVTSRDGRPTKIEGNPLHPASLGATDSIAQASILDLYDPDRSQTVTRDGEISTWDAFVAQMRREIGNLRSRGGAGLCVLSERITSPTLDRQRRDLLAALPECRWYEYGPADACVPDARRRWSDPGLTPIYDFQQASVVVSLDCDFLMSEAGAVRYARDFATARRAIGNRSRMSRLYAVESTLSATGAAADHRLALKPSEIEAFARRLANQFNANAAPEAVPNTPGGDARDSASQPLADAWIEAVAEDLRAAAGRSLVLAGRFQTATVHAIAHAMNATLGNLGRTVSYIEPTTAQRSQASGSIDQFVESFSRDSADVLLILDANPAYNLPPSVGFHAAIGKARLRIHCGAYRDETSALCHWHVPLSHFLESWSDARSYDGSASIVQPLIAPLYGTKTVHEVLSAMFGGSPRTSYDLVRETWRDHFGEDSETRWRRALHDGMIPGTRLPPAAAERVMREFALPPAPTVGSTASRAETEGVSGSLELVIRPDPSVGDGRYANNAWLQELPKPISLLTWENAVLLSPRTAQRLEVDNGHVLRLAADEFEVEGPVWVVPGHADDCATVHLGYGRTRGGRVAPQLGFDAYQLMASGPTSGIRQAAVEPTGKRARLACTQEHYRLEGRDHLRVVSIADLPSEAHAELDATAAERAAHEPASIYPEFEYPGAAWGMAIDLSACIGCNGCVVACQAENNIPVVGKPGVLTSREMHWLRIDRYFENDETGDPSRVAILHQPMLCQQCEKAPCEVVCPVGATTHSPEGLNEMTYNRCVGTRYCSNNCPYKVRRFNFYDYIDPEPSLALQRNPEVTVRSRGVMEKCTYCVQRINAARVAAKIEGIAKDEPPRIEDGAVVTACQAACPSRAIVFGDINDPASQVSKLKAQPHNYSALGELGTQPRTTYLARIRNPNPRLEKLIR